MTINTDYAADLGDISSEVLDECEAQFKKWGEQNHPHTFSEPKRVEYAKAADRYKQVNDARFEEESLSWDGILLEEVYEALAETDLVARRAELLQVAAVAISEVAAIDRELAAVSVESDFGDLFGEDDEDDE